MAEPLIALNEVRVSEEAQLAVLEVLRSGQLAQGPYVERFEALFAQLVGTECAVAVSNGTAAIIAALRVNGIGPGDEVIVPAFTFAATLNAVLDVGATAVVVDIVEDMTVDPDAVADAITERTAAVIPVHLYGYPADMDRVVELSTEVEPPRRGRRRPSSWCPASR
jgi:perosamine synthetase